MLRNAKIFLKGLFFIPHLILLVINNGKDTILKEANRAILPTGLPYRNFKALLWLLENDVYYRQFYYYRIGGTSAFVRWYTPGDRSFRISCKSIGGGI